MVARRTRFIQSSVAVLDKPETANSVSGDSTKARETEQNSADLTAKSPGERSEAILKAVAACDFLLLPADCERRERGNDYTARQIVEVNGWPFPAWDGQSCGPELPQWNED